MSSRIVQGGPLGPQMEATLRNTLSPRTVSEVAALMPALTPRNVASKLSQLKHVGLVDTHGARPHRYWITHKGCAVLHGLSHYRTACRLLRIAWGLSADG